MTTHANPDGDALGSALALAAGLKRLRKKVKVYNEDSVPSFLRFLPRWETVSRELSPAERYDAAFIVDCADLERVGEVFQNHRGISKKIVIDHHARSGRAGDVNLIEVDAASTGVVVHELLKRLQIPISKEIAYAIYCTLVTDTGSFRYSNTTASVFRLAHELVSAGVRPWIVSKNLFDAFPKERLQLLGRVLNSLEITSQGRVASIVLANKMLEETGATHEMAEEFINFPRSIDSVEVAVQFRETTDGKIKVSLRSKDVVDVAALAALFGGGGHKRAAGCTLEGPLEEVRQKIYAAVEESLMTRATSF